MLERRLQLPEGTVQVASLEDEPENTSAPQQMDTYLAPHAGTGSTGSSWALAQSALDAHSGFAAEGVIELLLYPARDTCYHLLRLYAAPSSYPLAKVAAPEGLSAVGRSGDVHAAWHVAAHVSPLGSTRHASQLQLEGQHEAARTADVVQAAAEALGVVAGSSDAALVESVNAIKVLLVPAHDDFAPGPPPSFGLMPASAEAALTIDYVAQLEASGLWHWAVFVALRTAGVAVVDRQPVVDLNDPGYDAQVIAREQGLAAGMLRLAFQVLLRATPDARRLTAEGLEYTRKYAAPLESRLPPLEEPELTRLIVDANTNAGAYAGDGQDGSFPARASFLLTSLGVMPAWIAYAVALRTAGSSTAAAAAVAIPALLALLQCDAGLLTAMGLGLIHSGLHSEGDAVRGRSPSQTGHAIHAWAAQRLHDILLDDKCGVAKPLMAAAAWRRRTDAEMGLSTSLRAASAGLQVPVAVGLCSGDILQLVSSGQSSAFNEFPGVVAASFGLPQLALMLRLIDARTSSSYLGDGRVPVRGWESRGKPVLTELAAAM
jgi:hypothetical protein